eukprot:759063-Hanusia_phi.AAC.1
MLSTRRAIESLCTRRRTHHSESSESYWHSLSGRVVSLYVLLSLLRQFESFSTAPIDPELPAPDLTPMIRSDPSL